MTKDPYEPKGKGKKAWYRLNAIEKEIKEIKEQLGNARNVLIAVIVAVPKQAFSEIEGSDEKKSEKIWDELKAKGYIDENGKITDQFKPNENEFKLNITYFEDVDEKDIINILQEFKDKEKDILDGKKKRAMIKDAPNRIEFEQNSLNFYIDFTVMVSEGDDPTNIKGSIVYGTSRTLCFSECIYPAQNEKCVNCDRILRCDRLEDKPLIQFSVNRNGIIKSKDKLEDEMWTTEIDDLVDLHYRTLDLIWKDALDWANEKLLP